VATGAVVEGGTVVVDGVVVDVVLVDVLVDAGVAGVLDGAGWVECTADEERFVEAFPPHAPSANRGSATVTTVRSQ